MMGHDLVLFYSSFSLLLLLVPNIAAEKVISRQRRVIPEAQPNRNLAAAHPSSDARSNWHGGSAGTGWGTGGSWPGSWDHQQSQKKQQPVIEEGSGAPPPKYLPHDPYAAGVYDPYSTSDLDTQASGAGPDDEDFKWDPNQQRPGQPGRNWPQPVDQTWLESSGDAEIPSTSTPDSRFRLPSSARTKAPVDLDEDAEISGDWFDPGLVPSSTTTTTERQPYVVITEPPPEPVLPPVTTTTQKWPQWTWEFTPDATAPPSPSTTSLTTISTDAATTKRPTTPLYATEPAPIRTLAPPEEPAVVRIESPAPSTVPAVTPPAIVPQTTPGPTLTEQRPREKVGDPFLRPGILAAVIGGAVVGLLAAILLVMFIVYRMRKKDEGSYALDEPKSPPKYPYAYHKAPPREFYA